MPTTLALDPMTVIAAVLTTMTRRTWRLKRLLSFRAYLASSLEDPRPPSKSWAGLFGNHHLTNPPWAPVWPFSAEPPGPGVCCPHRLNFEILGGSGLKDSEGNTAASTSLKGVAYGPQILCNTGGPGDAYQVVPRKYSHSQTSLLR